MIHRAYAYRQPKGDRLAYGSQYTHLTGYAALVIGSLAEGETVTLLGGVAAHQGLLKFPLVVLSVALGGMIRANQVLYLCGRRFGGKLLRRFSKHQDKIERAQQTYPTPSVSVCHWYALYVWLSAIGPTLIGASQLPPKIFLPLNILGAFAWAFELDSCSVTPGWSGDCAVVAHSRPAFEALGLVRSGRGSGGRRALVAETTRKKKPDNQA